MLVLTLLHSLVGLPLKIKGAVSDGKTVDLNRYWFISNLILKKIKILRKKILHIKICDFRCEKFTKIWFFEK